MTAVVPPRPDPLTNPYTQYSALFIDEQAFDQYLTQTPFNRVHADIAGASAIRPTWLSVDDYAWLKETQSMALGLNLDAASLGEHILAQYHAKHLPLAPALNTAIALPDLSQDL